MILWEIENYHNYVKHDESIEISMILHKVARASEYTVSIENVEGVFTLNSVRDNPVLVLISSVYNNF